MYNVVKAILFDFDGTITKPGAIDFSLVKRSIGCPIDMPILEFIKDVQSADRQKELMAELDRFEMEAAERSEPDPAIEELIPYIRSKGLFIGIISRNTQKALERALENFKAISPADFDVIISRNEPVDPKPSPDGIFRASEILNVDPSQILIVGDYIFDIQAGKSAGSHTVLIGNSQSAGALEADYVIGSLSELKQIIRILTPLPSGKFPNDLLKSMLDDFSFNDSSVLINPGIGEDIAAVDISGDEVLILKSDPITFATDSIGHYAVLVNANDIATSGAIPRWFLTTLLFPCGITPYEIFQVMRDLRDVCRKWGITLCGGHTEITDAVTRPVVTGMLAGTVLKHRLIDKRAMCPNDRILMTKSVAVEGTCIIAREFADRLRTGGMTDSDIELCQNLLFQISILEEARIAADTGGVSAMHDVTEGGIATALEELSVAGGHRIQIHIDRIPVFDHTIRISRMLGINPFGLIGSGTLLICCRLYACDKIMSRLRGSNISVTDIGYVADKGQGIIALKNGQPASWLKFDVDEITRLF